MYCHRMTPQVLSNSASLEPLLHDLRYGRTLEPEAKLANSEALEECLTERIRSVSLLVLASSELYPNLGIHLLQPVEPFHNGHVFVRFPGKLIEHVQAFLLLYG